MENSFHRNKSQETSFSNQSLQQQIRQLWKDGTCKRACYIPGLPLIAPNRRVCVFNYFCGNRILRIGSNKRHVAAGSQHSAFSERASWKTSSAEHGVRLSKLLQLGNCGYFCERSLLQQNSCYQVCQREQRYKMAKVMSPCQNHSQNLGSDGFWKQIHLHCRKEVRFTHQGIKDLSAWCSHLPSG